jgi:hypothetical protein
VSQNGLIAANSRQQRDFHKHLNGTDLIALANQK